MALAFYATTIGFILGIAITSTISVGVFGALLSLSMSAGFVGLWVIKRERAFGFTALFLFAIALGMARFEIAERMFPSDLSQFTDTTVELEGVVSREPDRREKTTHLYVDVERAGNDAVRGKVLAFHNRISDVQYGDRIIIRGELSAPTAFETELGRSFDYAGYLKAQGVSHTVFRPDIDISSSHNGSSIVASLLLVKHGMSRAIESALLSPESGLALGILLGEKHALGTDLLRIFRDAGVIHIVVLSGYNIAIMVEFLMRVLAFLSLRARVCLGGAVIILFVLMVGPTATVLRAAVMAVLALLARVTNRTYAIMRALMVAGVLMLVANPYLLRYDPGFQLSFLATLGLILVAPILERSVKHVPDVANIKGFALATIATQITVLPLLMYSMGAVSTVAILANILVLPIIPLAMLLSALVGVSGVFSAAAAAAIGYPASLLLFYVISVSEYLARIPFASVPLPPFPFILVVALYAIIGLWVYRAHREARTPEKVESKNPPTIAKQSSGDPFPFS